MTPWSRAPFEPRQWQRDALTAIMSSTEDRGLVQACTGSGKSIVIAELVRQTLPEAKGRIIITCPTIDLVDQLWKTIAGWVGPAHVGRFYTHRKEPNRPVIVCCEPSLGMLLAILEHANVLWSAWICDEAHRSESDRIKEWMAECDRKGRRPARSIGFTATPFRSDESEELSLWEKVVYTYTPADAIADGVVCPWDIVSWTGAEVSADEACGTMVKNAPFPAVVNAVDIADAEAFADYLGSIGLAAGTVHSRRSRSQNVEAIADLKHGALEVIVYVNMLKEGVDLPWLRTLCLRRPNMSRVRFCQEVGRVLRVYPGKDRAVIIDPWDMFGEYNLDDLEAVLAGQAPPRQHPFDTATDEIRRLKNGATFLEIRSALEGVDIPIRDISAAYLRRLVVALSLAGYIDQKIVSKHWRYNETTEAQARSADNMAWAIKAAKPPKAHKEALTVALASVPHLNRGYTSDLLTVLFALAQHKAWPNLDDALASMV